MDGTPAPGKSSGTGQSQATSHVPNPTRLPGQPVPQAYALTTSRAEADLPLAPSGYSSSSISAPTFGGSSSSMVAADGKFVRNESALNASNKELEQSINLGGQQLQAGLRVVFAKHEQVKVTLPSTSSEGHFLQDKALLSGLQIKYLELSGQSEGTAGTNAKLFAFETRSTLAASALSALNEIAVEQNDAGIQLGLVLSTTSSGDFTSMLCFAHARIRDALKADKLLVHLKLESLRQQREHSGEFLSNVLDGIEKHPKLQHLELSDTWMDAASARALKIAVESLPSLLSLKLDVTAESPEVEQILKSIKPRGTL